MDDKTLVDSARDQLNRILGFFPRVDAKASVVLAVDTGMLGFLVSNVPKLSTLAWWELALPALTTALLGFSLWNIYKQASPNLKGGQMSLVYFREIASRTESKFIDEFMKQTETDHVKDLLGQVWRNSEILKDKFDYLKTAFVFVALAIPPWVVSLVIFAVKTATKTTVTHQ